MNQYSNNKADHDCVVAWREAAIADGWILEKTFVPEPADSYGHIKRGEFTGHICARERVKMEQYYPKISHGKFEFHSSISLWGPDGVSIIAPFPYSWDAITKGLRHCEVCGKDDVETVRVAFCNRACIACAPALRAKLETRGWCD